MEGAPAVSRFWSRICDVDVEALALWARGPLPWPARTDPTKPLRIWAMAGDLVGPLVSQILAHFSPPVIARDACLSLMPAGDSHPMHVDSEPATFITRVHVPLTTNPGCWFEWEEESRRVHFDVGAAYCFDTQSRHAFGNDGESDRIHLLFDVWRSR